MINGEILKLLRSPVDEMSVVFLDGAYYQLSNGKQVPTVAIRAKSTGVFIKDLSDRHYADLVTGWDTDSELLKWASHVRTPVSSADPHPSLSSLDPHPTASKAAAKSRLVSAQGLYDNALGSYIQAKSDYVAANREYLSASGAHKESNSDETLARVTQAILALNKAEAMKKATPILKLPGMRGYKWPSLMEAYKVLVNPEGFEGAHSALADVHACHKVLLSLEQAGVPLVY